MVSGRGKDLRLALGSERLWANKGREWRRAGGIKANFLYRKAWAMKRHTCAPCVWEQLGPLALMPGHFPPPHGRLATYLLTCLKQHVFPSCSSLSSKIGNAHTCRSSAFSPLAHRTQFAPFQIRLVLAFTYIHTYAKFTQSHFNWCPCLCV